LRIKRKNINTGSSSDYFLLYSKKETWEHSVQCRNTVSMRAEFNLESYEDLKKLQVIGVRNEEVRTLIEDIRKFLREYLEDFENNQQEIRMQHLCRASSIKA